MTSGHNIVWSPENPRPGKSPRPPVAPVMRALDLFCGAGGVAMGLHRAGFEVTGVDINPQPNYPFAFIQDDALDYLEGLIFDRTTTRYDFIWASPPCQAYSVGTTYPGARETHPDLIPATRELLEASGLPYVIENVPGAPLQAPTRLCGVMFDLRVVRHRNFESNFPMWAPKHIKHHPPIERPALDGTDRIVKRSWYMTVAGHGGHSNSYKLEDWQAAMEIDWMTKAELVEAIPPKYSEFIGKQAIQAI